MPAQEIATLAPVAPVALHLLVNILVSGARLVAQASRNISCKFEQERANGLEVVGEIASGADELLALSGSCRIFRSRNIA